MSKNTNIRSNNNNNNNNNTDIFKFPREREKEEEEEEEDDDDDYSEYSLDNRTPRMRKTFINNKKEVVRKMKNFTIILKGTINNDGSGIIVTNNNNNSSIQIDNDFKILKNNINFDKNGKITTSDNNITFTGGSRKSSRKTNRKRPLGKGKRGKSMRRRQ